MTEPILRAERLVKTYSGRQRPAVNDVSLSLCRGEVLGLVGESGSGKSSTARLVVGLSRPDSGRILFEDIDVTAGGSRSARRQRAKMQMVFQDPYSSLNPRMSVEQLVGEGLLVHHIEQSRDKRRVRVCELLELVGLPTTILNRYPRSFSGGQRQRIAIARALAASPTLLICDEPVSSLDVSVQAQVLNLFRDLREQLNLSILFIAHDLGVVHYLCDRVAVMQQGRIVEMAEREKLYSTPQHPYSRELLDAVPVPDPRIERARRPVYGESASN